MFEEKANRRQDTRVMFPCVLKLSSLGNEQDSMLTHTENLSVGGIGVVLRREIPVGTLLDLELDLMDAEDHVVCKGRVVGSVRRKMTDTRGQPVHEISIEFLGQSNETRAHIVRVVEVMAKIGLGLS